MEGERRVPVFSDHFCLFFDPGFLQAGYFKTCSKDLDDVSGFDGLGDNAGTAWCCFLPRDHSDQPDRANTGKEILGCSVWDGRRQLLAIKAANR